MTLKKLACERRFSLGWEDSPDALKLIESKWNKQSLYVNRTSWSPLSVEMRMRVWDTLYQSWWLCKLFILPELWVDDDMNLNLEGSLNFWCCWLTDLIFGFWLSVKFKMTIRLPDVFFFPELYSFFKLALNYSSDFGRRLIATWS
jgi:hypothetical protein